MTLRLFSIAAACLAAAPLAHAAAENYIIDTNFTMVYWEVKHFATSTSRGRFLAKGGSITLDQQAKQGKVEVVIDMPTISTGVAPFDAKLKSEDFFDTHNYPEGRFSGERMRFENDILKEVRGDLTLRDKTMPTTLTASNFKCYTRPAKEAEPAKEICGGDFETTISRGQFGMSYGWPFVSDKVRLLIQIEAVKQ
jgi:polyisoprenoid-binding protein YceI